MDLAPDPGQPPLELGRDGGPNALIKRPVFGGVEGGRVLLTHRPSDWLHNNGLRTPVVLRCFKFLLRGVPEEGSDPR